MNERIGELQQAIELLHQAFLNVIDNDRDAIAIIDKAFSALDQHSGEISKHPAKSHPAVKLMTQALDLAQQGSDHSSAFANVLDRLLPKLHWIKAENLGKNSKLDNLYAEAYLVGPNGIEERTDVQIGISILAPNVAYPDHRHAPDEIYLALTGGLWRQNTEDFQFYNAGECIFNPSNTLHAVAAQDYPQLSVWLLSNLK